MMILDQQGPAHNSRHRLEAQLELQFDPSVRIGARLFAWFDVTSFGGVASLAATERQPG